MEGVEPDQTSGLDVPLAEVSGRGLGKAGTVVSVAGDVARVRLLGRRTRSVSLVFCPVGQRWLQAHTEDGMESWSGPGPSAARCVCMFHHHVSPTQHACVWACLWHVGRTEPIPLAVKDDYMGLGRFQMEVRDVCLMRAVDVIITPAAGFGC